jgi:hypothetical protein
MRRIAKKFNSQRLSVVARYQLGEVGGLVDIRGSRKYRNDNDVRVFDCHVYSIGTACNTDFEGK